MLHKATDAILDVSAIIEYFGGAHEVARAFKRYHLANLSIYGVRQWSRRQRIPLNRQLDLQVIAEKQDRKFRLEQFFLPDLKTPQKRKPKEARA